MTPKERREKRKLAKQQQTEGTELGFQPPNKNDNQAIYYRNMTWKAGVSLANYIHDAKKAGIDLGTIGELELTPLLTELREKGI